MDHKEAATVLGLDVNKHLNKSEVDQAYRSASLAAHPDRGGSNEQFQEVSTAKETLYEEIDTGHRIEKSDINNNVGETTETPNQSSNCWAGEKYNTPSTQSPLSPLRQMGRPVDLATMQPHEVVELWEKRQLQCVWRCDCCDAVCCRVRREKFRCVCSHQLRYHDAGNGFKCTCQAKTKAHDSAVHKGPCKCKKFEFLVSFGMWTAKCICKHGHDAHDPETLVCRKCDTDSATGCPGWSPTFQCHCGHGCDHHRTAFVHGFLSQGHRDWVVSGVRLETARIAEKFRERPLEEQIKLRASMGMSEGMFFNVFTSAQEGNAKKQSRENHASNSKCDTPSKSSDKSSSQTDDVFARNQMDIQNRLQRRESLKAKLKYEDELQTSFTPRTNHKSSVKKIMKKVKRSAVLLCTDRKEKTLTGGSSSGRFQETSPPTPPIASAGTSNMQKVRVPKPKKVPTNTLSKLGKTPSYLELIAELTQSDLQKAKRRESACVSMKNAHTSSNYVEVEHIEESEEDEDREDKEEEEEEEEEVSVQKEEEEKEDVIHSFVVSDISDGSDIQTANQEEVRIYKEEEEMMSELQSWLSSHRLDCAREAFIDVGGAECLQDLSLLDDVDLDELGLDVDTKLRFWEAMEENRLWI